MMLISVSTDMSDRVRDSKGPIICFFLGFKIFIPQRGEPKQGLTSRVYLHEAYSRRNRAWAKIASR